MRHYLWIPGIAVAVFISLGVRAQSLSRPTGIFTEAVWVTGSMNKKECKEIAGTWSRIDGCLVSEVNVVRVDEGRTGYRLSIETVEPHGHVCDFSADAQLLDRNRLVAKVEVQNFIFDSATQTGSRVNEICEVSVVYSNDNLIKSVTDNGKCDTFCGVRASLDVRNASRVR